MKNMKKILALVIAMLLVLGMTSALATSISVSKPSGAATTHTYDVFQIFTGTVVGSELTEIQYGSSHPNFTVKDQADNYVPKTVLDGLTTEAEIRDYILGTNAINLRDRVGQVVEDGAALTVADGYYLLKDVSYTAANVDDAFSAIIVQVISGDITVTPKRVKPTVDKQVNDNDDGVSSGDNNGWGETADHKIGESFQFKLTATLPVSADYAQYPTYMVRFNDTMSDGVTFESIESVTVDGVTVGSSGYTCTATAGQAGGSWALTIADLKTIAGVDLTDGASVVVVYNAHLNAAAEVKTATGDMTENNRNGVTLTYSNNPDATGEGGTDTTEEDYVWTFTYGNNGTKTDATNTPLPDAGFTLYPGTVADDADLTQLTPINLYKSGNNFYVYNASATAGTYTGNATVDVNPADVVTEMRSDANGHFNVKGLDVGTYTLVETHVPEGYVKSTNTTFTITATHSETNATTAHVDLGNSSTSETVVNYTGNTLPSTGGMGTTILYIGGSILVLAAAILLITKRRMGSED